MRPWAPRSSTVVAAFSAFFMFATATLTLGTPSSAQSAVLEVSLPDGEERIEKRARVAVASFQPDPLAIPEPPYQSVAFIDTEVSGSGAIEVMVRLEGTEMFDEYTNRDPSTVGTWGNWVTEHVAELQRGGQRVGLVYRALLLEPDRERLESNVVLNAAMIGFIAMAYDEESIPFETMIGSLELVVTLQRVDEYCTLSAQVSGDINDNFFGDSAYFNTAAYPVKKGMMVGTIGETQTHDTMAGFGTVDVSKEGALDLAAQLGLISEEEAEQAAENIEDEEGNQQEEQAESGGFAEWAGQQLRAENPDEGDNFGLNLADIKADVTPESAEGAAAMFAGAFTLSVSGRIGQVPDQQRIVVVPSLVMATVGLSDKGGDRISFELIEGNPLSIDFAKVTDDFIIGTIKGELQTKGPYKLEGVTSKPRKLKIDVAAHFAARRGSLSCMQ